MSILRRKLDRVSGLPDIVSDKLGAWGALHSAVAEGLSRLTGALWEPAGVSVSQGEGKAFVAQLEDVGLAFNHASSDDQFPVFAFFDASLSAYVSSHSFGAPLPKAQPAAALQMLDLILFKPVHDDLVAELSKLVRTEFSGRSNVVTKAQGLSPSIFDVGRGTGFWNELIFLVKRTEPEEVKGKKSKKPPADVVLDFRLIAPEALMVQIASSYNPGDDAHDLEAAGPWAEQIYQSVKSARVPIRAVVESCEMTVADCTRLEVDDVIQLPGVSLESVSLQTDMNEGPVNIGLASLGIFKSNWALKLSEEINKDIFVGLKARNVEGSEGSIKE